MQQTRLKTETKGLKKIPHLYYSPKQSRHPTYVCVYTFTTFFIVPTTYNFLINPYISFFHLLVNGFTVTCFPYFFLANCYRVIH